MSEGEIMLQDKVRKIREIVEGKDDPAFAQMLEVVREHVGHKMCMGMGKCLLFWRMELGDCQGTGYITRSWEGMPKGALWGTFYTLARTERIRLSKIEGSDLTWAWWDKLGQKLHKLIDDDLSCDAVIAALKT